MPAKNKKNKKSDKDQTNFENIYRFDFKIPVPPKPHLLAKLALAEQKRSEEEMRRSRALTALSPQELREIFNPPKPESLQEQFEKLSIQNTLTSTEENIQEQFDIK